MKKTGLWFLLGAVVLGTGCYHAVIETGLTPNGEKISQPWAMGFAWGLVPPPVVNAAAKCPNGVARVETQHSFLNSLVETITWGIVTPMRIDVQCAAKRSAQNDGTVMQVGGDADFQQAVSQAVRASERSGEPVYLVF